VDYLIGCPRLVIRSIRSYFPHLGGRLRQPQLEDAPCYGDRKPLNMVLIPIYSQLPSISGGRDRHWALSSASWIQSTPLYLVYVRSILVLGRIYKLLTWCSLLGLSAALGVRIVRLIAREDYIKFTRRESTKTYKVTYLLTYFLLHRHTLNSSICTWRLAKLIN
jgi:hypothetical protein